MLWTLVEQDDLDAAFLRELYMHTEKDIMQHGGSVAELSILLTADLHYRLQHPWDSEPPRLPPRAGALVDVVRRQVSLMRVAHRTAWLLADLHCCLTP